MEMLSPEPDRVGESNDSLASEIVVVDVFRFYAE